MRISWVPQPVRHAIRRLAHDRLLSGVAVLSLALGIGAAAAIFSLVNAAGPSPLPYRPADRLVLVREVVPELRGVYPTVPVNIQHFPLWRPQAPATASMAPLETRPATLTRA